jgi:hypothetical protein
MAGLASPANAEDYKAAVERLIASGIFERSPSLGLMLTYICRKYFEGKSEEIKEYNIAVEAFGRPPEFDKKKDSIVRVEAHRLRKRLQQYYAGAGASDPVEILIPEGSYVPEFRRRTTVTLPPVPRYWSGHRALGILSLILLAAFLAIILSIRPRPGAAIETVPALAAAKVAATRAPAPGEEIRILAGRGSTRYTDRYGQVWEGDRFFTGGESVVPRHQIVKGLDPNFFGGLREGDFRYDIPLKAGTYELHLIFAETEYGEGNALAGTEAYRLFDVTLNGKPLLPTFDVIAEAAGSNNAAVKIFKDISPAQDGYLHLGFNSLNGTKAFVNAIEILPGTPGKMRPIRMVARSQPYRDAVGNLWEPDHFVNSGIVVVRPSTPPGPNAELYRGERYGNFTYSVPVAQGRYGVTFYFNEFWFGPRAPGLGGPGSRVFRVYANHKLLMDNFDLFKTAGDSMRAVQKSFHGLQPSPLGKIEFHFEPIVNFAMVNAIEIFDDTP